jgi:hypothetical protein
MMAGCDEDSTMSGEGDVERVVVGKIAGNVAESDVGEPFDDSVARVGNVDAESEAQEDDVAPAGIEFV